MRKRLLSDEHETNFQREEKINVNQTLHNLL